jgi:hypothetical protein
MIQLEKSVLIDKPVREVFSFVSNHNNTTKWQGGVEAVIPEAQEVRGKANARQASCLPVDPPQKAYWECLTSRIKSSCHPERMRRVSCGFEPNGPNPQGFSPALASGASVTSFGRSHRTGVLR